MTSSTNLFYTFVLFLDISLQQYCDQIDQIEASVSKLEQTAYRLDNYAKQLGIIDYFVVTVSHTRSL